jgi:hypothetical protein
MCFLLAESTMLYQKNKETTIRKYLLLLLGFTSLYEIKRIIILL